MFMTTLATDQRLKCGLSPTGETNGVCQQNPVDEQLFYVAATLPRGTEIKDSIALFYPAGDPHCFVTPNVCWSRCT